MKRTETNLFLYQIAPSLPLPKKSNGSPFGIDLFLGNLHVALLKFKTKRRGNVIYIKEKLTKNDCCEIGSIRIKTACMKTYDSWNIKFVYNFPRLRMSRGHSPPFWLQLKGAMYHTLSTHWYNEGNQSGEVSNIRIFTRYLKRMACWMK